MVKIDKRTKEILNKIRIAHRGLWDDFIPENSIGAFERCIKKNIPIELDIHLLKDNTLVVFHDDNLKRLTGLDSKLKDCAYNDIKNLKLKKTNYKILTFEEVLNLVSGKVLLDIELKFDVNSFKICNETCKYLDKYNGDFIIKSFNPLYIWWFRKNRPLYIRGLLVSKLKKSKINKFVKLLLFKMCFNFLAKPDFIAFNYKDLPNKKIEKLRRNGIPILLFTVNEKDIINYEKDYSGFLYEK